ncbi:MAG: GAP family protein [Caldilineaceae bacterium]|nr:GAP family protein [Caldilineaceae bacterium]HRJ41776.1 GAP family protein [Caldilineaceae bacterium]
MLPVLIETLLLASAGILSFGAITLTILLLISDRGWLNGLAFALGYLGGYALLGVAAVMLGYRSTNPSNDGPGVIFPSVLLLLGGLLLWVGWRNSRKPPVEKPEPPRFFAMVDNISPIRALGFGGLVSVINVKNLALFLTAQSVVILSSLSLAEKIVITLVAALVFSLSVLLPVLIFVSVPRQAAAILNRLKVALDKNSRAIGIWVPLIFGLLFLVVGYSYLA